MQQLILPFPAECKIKSFKYVGCKMLKWRTREKKVQSAAHEWVFFFKVQKVFLWLIKAVCLISQVIVSICYNYTHHTNSWTERNGIIYDSWVADMERRATTMVTDYKICLVCIWCYQAAGVHHSCVENTEMILPNSLVFTQHQKMGCRSLQWEQKTGTDSSKIQCKCAPHVTGTYTMFCIKHTHG